MTRNPTADPAEEHVQNAAADQHPVSQAVAAENSAALADDAPPIPSLLARQSEEMRMLLLGFGTGLTIAGVFLIYIVFAYAKWLP
jgi:hypothetical protein